MSTTLGSHDFNPLSITIPWGPTLPTQRSCSNAFLEDIQRLYTYNAAHIASLADICAIEQHISSTTVTNSLLFSGNMRMQGITRDLLKKEYGRWSFLDLMNCVSVSSSKPILANISRRFTGDAFLCSAGKSNSILGQSLLEKICRAIVTGTGELCKKHEKSVKQALTPDSIPAQDISSSLITSVAAAKTDNILEMPFTTLDFGTLSISSNGVGMQTISDSGSPLNDLSTSSKSKPPEFIADMNLAISKKKRVRAVSASDENTPPSKKRAPSTSILASHRRFASMPLQTLLSGTDGTSNETSEPDTHEDGSRSKATGDPSRSTDFKPAVMFGTPAAGKATKGTHKALPSLKPNPFAWPSVHKLGSAPRRLGPRYSFHPHK